MAAMLNFKNGIKQGLKIAIILLQAIYHVVYHNNVHIYYINLPLFLSVSSCALLTLPAFFLASKALEVSKSTLLRSLSSTLGAFFDKSSIDNIRRVQYLTPRVKS